MAFLLPKQRVGESYPLTAGASDRFVDDSPTLIGQVANKMAVDDLEDSARIPSPFSRMISFHLELVGRSENGQEPVESLARAKARKSFRGICSFFALRHILGVEIKEKSYAWNPPADGWNTVLEAAYKRAMPNLMNLGSEWKNFRFIVSPESGSVCALSPYTLFFPTAAKSSGLDGVFWYDPETGEWEDPTTGGKADFDRWRIANTSIRVRTIQMLRRLILDWIGLTLKEGTIVQSLQTFGMEINDAKAVESHLKIWRRQLSELDSRDIEPGSDESHHTLRDSSADGEQVAGNPPTQPKVPIIGFPISVSDEKRLDSYLSLLTELPVHKDQLLVSKAFLSDSNRRICGRLYGSPQLANENMPRLAEKGESLVLNFDGRRYFVACPFINLDALFTPTLTMFARSAPSKYFKMAIADSKSWLFPFEHLALELFNTNDEFVNAVELSCKKGQSGETVIQVALKIPNCEPTIREYTTKERNRWSEIVPVFDMLLWPNFEFPTANPTHQNTVNIPPLQTEDRSYYLRVRQESAWNLGDPKGILKNNTTISSSLLIPLDWGGGVENSVIKFHQCEVYKLGTQPDQTLVGFSFPKKGFVLTTLSSPTANRTLQSWDVAVDFGTSNTCVAYRTGGGQYPTVLSYQPLTAHARTRNEYEALDLNSMLQADETNNKEGGADALEFPHLTPVDQPLYFPTQAVSRSQETAIPTAFEIQHGVLFPINIIDAGAEISQLIYGRPPRPTGPDLRPFFLYDDIKWKNNWWRPAFLARLYKWIVFEATQRGVRINSFRFSYPKAFDTSAILHFNEEMKAIFGGYDPQTKILGLESESAAVGRFVKAGDMNGRDHIVLDIGGGTTDFVGIVGETAAFQASYKLAGGYLNKYVAGSNGFLETLLKVVQKRTANKTTHPDQNQITNNLKVIGDVIQSTRPKNEAHTYLDTIKIQSCFWLLKMYGVENYGSLSGDLTRLPDLSINQKTSIRSFFLSTLLVYTGAVYGAGRLLRESGKKSEMVLLQFVGNGSKFLKLIHTVPNNGPMGPDLKHLLEKAFRLGYGSDKCEVAFKIPEDGKTLVAKGMLSGGDENYAEPPVVPDRASIEHWIKAAGKPDADTSAEPIVSDELDAFLALIERELPGGKVLNEIPGIATKQQGQIDVIPFCSNNISDSWRMLVKGCAIRFGQEERKVVKEVGKILDGKRFDQLSEPSKSEINSRATKFMVHLGCLLDEIRDKSA